MEEALADPTAPESRITNQLLQTLNGMPLRDLLREAEVLGERTTTLHSRMTRLGLR